MSRALGEAHRRYTNFIHARSRWTGHLFQSRFASVAMDESNLKSAVAYVSLNPVRARLVSRAEEWAWSSVRAHLAGEDDSLVSVRPVLDRWPNFRDLLLEGYEEKFTSLREAEGIGRPLGMPDFVTELEHRLGRPIAHPVSRIGESLPYTRRESRRTIDVPTSAKAHVGTERLPGALKRSFPRINARVSTGTGPPVRLKLKKGGQPVYTLRANFPARLTTNLDHKSPVRSQISRQSEPGPGQACVSCRAMGMVECAGTSCRRG